MEPKPTARGPGAQRALGGGPSPRPLSALWARRGLLRSLFISLKEWVRGPRGAGVRGRLPPLPGPGGA